VASGDSSSPAPVSPRTNRGLLRRPAADLLQLEPNPTGTHRSSGSLSPSRRPAGWPTPMGGSGLWTRPTLSWSPWSPSTRSTATTSPSDQLFRRPLHVAEWRTGPHSGRRAN